MTRPLSLGDQREPALEHAAALVARAWREFDQAREVETACPRPPSPDCCEEPCPRARATSSPTWTSPPTCSTRRSRSHVRATSPTSGPADSRSAPWPTSSRTRTTSTSLSTPGPRPSSSGRPSTGWPQFLGFPAATGSFTSGGTISNITALAAARERALPGSRTTGMHGHSSARSTAPPRRTTRSPARPSSSASGATTCAPSRSTTAAGCRPDAPRRRDRRGRWRSASRPSPSCASAGTTLTGAVDPIGAIADVCQERGVWLHVDGAYGLPAAAAPTSAALFAGLDRVDSLSVDAHKWMFVPRPAVRSSSVARPISLPSSRTTRPTSRTRTTRSTRSTSPSSTRDRSAR